MVNILIVVVIVLAVAVFILLFGSRPPHESAYPYNPPPPPYYGYGNGYHHDTYHRPRGISSLFIVFLMVLFGYLIVEGVKIKDSASEFSIAPGMDIERKAHDPPKPYYFDEGEGPPDWKKPRRRSKEELNLLVDRDTSSYRMEIPVKEYVDEYNQDLPMYAIQVSASSILRFAEEKAQSYSEQFDNVVRVKMPGSAPFRIMIGPFKDEASARDFMKKYQLKGFIKDFSRDYIVW